MVQAIEEVSRILPDTAFLQAVAIKGKNLILQGQAAQPEALIALLEASPALSAVSFSTSVYRNSSDQLANFAISAVIDDATDIKAAP